MTHHSLIALRVVALTFLSLFLFVFTGTDYLRLSLFAKQRIMDSTYSGGLVLQAFTTGVRRFLQYYQALVQVVPAESKKLTLLAIKDMFSELTSQLR